MADLEQWRGRVALVTGASSGIGRATARALAENGMRVAMCARRGDRLQALSVELQSLGADTLSLPADLRHSQEITRVFDAVRDRWGGVDVLVNNAAIGHKESLVSGNPERWREMWELNVLALSVCTQMAIEDMRRRGDNGYVIHICSMAGHRQNPAGSGNGMYTATKQAVLALTEALRRELRVMKSGIRVSAISPGTVETEFAEQYHHSQEKAREIYSQFHPLQPENIADIILYFLSCPPHVQIHDVLVRPTEQPT